jgi:hypothetical protein
MLSHLFYFVIHEAKDQVLQVPVTPAAYFFALHFGTASQALVTSSSYDTAICYL